MTAELLHDSYRPTTEAAAEFLSRSFAREVHIRGVSCAPPPPPPPLSPLSHGPGVFASFSPDLYSSLVSGQPPSSWPRFLLSPLRLHRPRIWQRWTSNPRFTSAFGALTPVETPTSLSPSTSTGLRLSGRRRKAERKYRELQGPWSLKKMVKNRFSKGVHHENKKREEAARREQARIAQENSGGSDGKAQVETLDRSRRRRQTTSGRSTHVP